MCYNKFHFFFRVFKFYLMLCLGMGMHSWERSSLECIDFVHNIWNVVSWSKLGSLSLPRELCKWLWSIDSNFPHLWACYWSWFASQGTFVVFITIWWYFLDHVCAVVDEINANLYCLVVTLLPLANPFGLSLFISGHLSLWIRGRIVYRQQWTYTKGEMGIMGHPQALACGYLRDDILHVQL